HYHSNTPITQQHIQSPPLQSYAPTVVQQPPTIQPNIGFVVPTFLPTDDPIASLNKALIFLSRQSQGYAGGTNIQEKDKKKAKNKQNRARNGKDKVKSKSKVNQVKKIQLKGLKLPNLKLYYKS
ncbi:hypothetical protein Tco_0581047, partial [Tanacetum coccineum]